MRGAWAYHLLFAGGLLALAALGGWWLIFFERSVDAECTARLMQLRSAAEVMALRLGHGPLEPEPGPLPDSEIPIEVVRTSDHEGDAHTFASLPNFPGLGVRPTQAALDGLKKRARRRWLMVVGEGGFLCLLIALCSFMLYRLVSQERRSRQRLESFISTITHEMKTPLAGIKSLLQTLVAGRVPAEHIRRLYGLGLEECERLEHMIENTLLSGRLRVDAHEIELRNLNLRVLLERFVAYRRRYLVERPNSIELLWALPTDTAFAVADNDALVAVLENLADNAFKYGGEQPQVVVRAQRENGHLLVSVEDQGIGFDPRNAGELFEPFRRIQNGGTLAQHGTGLGLSIARTLARKMGGDLSACSEGPDRGSCFTVQLREAKHGRASVVGGG